MESSTLYHKYKDGKHRETHPTIYAERFAELLSNNHFIGQIVDAGCGTGRDVSFFHNYGFNVLGIDYSNHELLTAREKFSSCDFQKQDIENLSLQDNSVNAYFMVNVIHYLNQEKALGEIYRTLSDNGHLFIHFNTSIVDGQGNVDYQQDDDEINDLVSDFDVVDRKVFERVDIIPKKHTPQILELILQKR